MNNMAMNQVTQSEEVLELAGRIKSMLAGKDPLTQSAVLAELLSIWLAGHLVLGDEEQTLELRTQLLAAHCELVRDLTRINARIIGELREVAE